MPMTLSGNGTITGLVAGGLPDGTVVGSDLASGAAASNLAGSTIPGDLTFSNSFGVRVENPAGGRFGSLRTTSVGTELSSHNGSGEPVIIKAPSSTGYVAIETNAGTRLTVSSSGHVTMPNQPAFMARRTNTFIINNSTLAIVFNDDAIMNRAGYSTSTGRFTAPVSGAYFLAASVQPASTGGLVRIEIRRNGTSYQFTSSGWTSLPSRGDINIQQTIFLAAGDYADVLVTTNYNCSFDNHGHFTGFLIG
jgi:hypothetical protein